LPQHASVHLMADGKSTLCPMDTLTGLTLSLVHRAAPITSSSSFRWRSTATPTAWPRAFGADTSTPATSLGGSGSELARDPRGAKRSWRARAASSGRSQSGAGGCAGWWAVTRYDQATGGLYRYQSAISAPVAGHTPCRPIIYPRASSR
jgi:hypothetical protein